MPKDSEGSTGSSYIVDRKNRKVLIPIDVNKIEDIKELLGTVTEEVAHGKDALEGRQDKKVAEDKSNDEEGLESLGRPANEYVKKRFGEDNNSEIKLTTDGIDLSNADVGEKVGDVTTSEDRKFKKYYHKETNKLEILIAKTKDFVKGNINDIIEDANIYHQHNDTYYLALGCIDDRLYYHFDTVTENAYLYEIYDTEEDADRDDLIRFRLMNSMNSQISRWKIALEYLK